VGQATHFPFLQESLPILNNADSLTKDFPAIPLFYQNSFNCSKLFCLAFLLSFSSFSGTRIANSVVFGSAFFRIPRNFPRNTLTATFPWPHA